MDNAQQGDQLEAEEIVVIVGFRDLAQNQFRALGLQIRYVAHHLVPLGNHHHPHQYMSPHHPALGQIPDAKMPVGTMAAGVEAVVAS